MGSAVALLAPLANLPGPMKSLLALAFLATACLAPALSAEPGNEVVLTIPSTAEHPRNSEGSFVTLKSGRIEFYYSQFYGGSGDDSRGRIVEIHSDDGGRTWSSPLLKVDNQGLVNVMSVSLLRLASGKIALFYSVKRTGWTDCRIYFRLSPDEGATWSEAAQVGDAPPSWFVLNNDRVIQTRTGRLIAPLAQHRITGTKDVIASWGTTAPSRCGTCRTTRGPIGGKPRPGGPSPSPPGPGCRNRA